MADTTEILAQFAEAGSIFVFVFGLTYVFFKALAAQLLRVSREVELQGLDLPEMGTLGYPTDWEPSNLDQRGNSGSSWRGSQESIWSSRSAWGLLGDLVSFSWAVESLASTAQKF